jgi:UDP-3-O-[3-hydroxymyristoyl] glucosamine N-acyltransferase
MGEISLAELAAQHGLGLQGRGDVPIRGVCTLSPGRPGHLGFLANPKYRSQLASSAAAAVVLGERDAAASPLPALIAKDPYLAFARIARRFDPVPPPRPGRHPSAFVAEDATVAADAEVGAFAVIESGARVGSAAVIGAHSHVGAAASIGDGSRLEGRNWIGPRCVIGARARLNAGCVIGARGFGLAPTPQGWEEVPQLGRVIIGDDVEVGANTCIDRGAIEDTVIGNGVKLDNLIQIAHNVVIGEHTAIAAHTAIAGSTVIGRRCLIGGAVGIAGHLVIGDDVVILARAMVTHSLPEKGSYGSGLPIAPAREWRRQVAHIRRLDKYDQRLRALMSAQGIDDAGQDASGTDTP